MPYKVYKAGGQYCVHKLSEGGGKGEKVACHASKDKADAQMRALYANEGDSGMADMKEKEAELQEEGDATKEWHYVPYDVTSFAEYDMHAQAKEMQEHLRDMSSIFEQLVSNVLYDSGIKDKETALTKLVADYATRCKAMSMKMGMEEKETSPATEELPQEKQANEKSQTSNFFLFKEANGDYRWFAIYSNNFRDHDRTPEIISEKSHTAFSYLVKEGLVPYPELWHWHVPGTRWGVADYVDYCNGMAYATGLVDAGKENEADALKEMDLEVSHGMPNAFIVRNPEDATVIDFHITREISPLPRGKAANRFTGFVVL